MERIYHDITTFLGGLEPIVKGLIIGMLCILILLSLRSIVKTHVNPKKPIFKLGQFVLLAILVAITVFVCIHVF
ncbi:MAG: hypothetical protein J6T74_07045 [Clostridia bacterium]|nr:hypothetical protein [Clostridia bacterium]